jgi:hypothetical protein
MYTHRCLPDRCSSTHHANTIHSSQISVESSISSFLILKFRVECVSCSDAGEVYAYE